jgi:UDP-glucuronate 4-epimerase
MEKILITGGAGFIGSHLAQRLLLNRKQLAIVDNLDEYYPPEFKRANLEAVANAGKFDYFQVDIRDAARLSDAFESFKPEAVIHLAARPGVRMSFVQPEAYASINVVGTTQVLEISRLSGVQKVLFASSSSVYGHTSHAPFSEDAVITKPLSVYAATKVAGEALAFTYAQAYNLPVICLRLFTVYGPRQRPDLAIRKFANLILQGKEIPIFGDGRLERDYTYIDDIVDGIVLALNCPSAFDIFNLGNCHPLPIDAMVTALAGALGKPAMKKFIPTPPGEMLKTHADLTKARNELGYSPKVPFDQGIQRFANWLKSAQATHA